MARERDARSAKHFFPLLSWVEAAEARDRGVVVLLPIGTMDANGPQLPMGFDYLVASSLAEQVAERTDSLWLPPLSFGVSEALAAFPGTVAIPAELLSAQIEAIVMSLIANGFTHVVLINNHGPNQPPAESACRRIRRSTDVVVPIVFPGALFGDLGRDLFEERRGSVGHGSEPGTSLLLHLYPDAVRMDLARAAEAERFQGLEVLSPSEVRFGDSKVNFFLDLSEVSASGGWGDPSGASAEVGKLLFDRMVDFTSDFVVRFRDMDARPAVPPPHLPEG